MVKVTVTATNASDVYTRFWGVFLDAQPAAGWDVTGPTVEIHSSGDHMTVDLPASDGNHVVYFITSNPQSQGTYSGVLNVDSVSRTFAGANITSAISCSIVVKNGVASAGSGSPSTTTSGSIVAKTKAFFMAPANRNNIIIGLVLLAVSALVAWKLKHKRRRF